MKTIKRGEMIDAIIQKQYDAMDLSDVEIFVKNGFRQELERGSETLVQMEYKEWVDPDFELP